jgi:DNA-binding GntR family transcriptional regulator
MAFGIQLKCDHAYRGLLALILNGGVELDTPFSECKLAAFLGVGWAYLSDTLRGLACERFLEIKPAWKTVARALSIEDLQEIYEVRIPLEGMTALPAADRGPTLELTSYKPKFCDIINNSKVYDPLETYEKYAAFNSEVLRSTRNWQLLKIYERLRLHFKGVFGLPCYYDMTGSAHLHGNISTFWKRSKLATARSSNSLFVTTF